MGYSASTLALDPELTRAKSPRRCRFAAARLVPFDHASPPRHRRRRRAPRPLCRSRGVGRRSARAHSPRCSPIPEEFGSTLRTVRGDSPPGPRVLDGRLRGESFLASEHRSGPCANVIDELSAPPGLAGDPRARELPAGHPHHSHSPHCTRSGRGHRRVDRGARSPCGTSLRGASSSTAAARPWQRWDCFVARCRAHPATNSC